MEIILRNYFSNNVYLISNSLPRVEDKEHVLNHIFRLNAVPRLKDHLTASSKEKLFQLCRLDNLFFLLFIKITFVNFNILSYTPNILLWPVGT